MNCRVRRLLKGFASVAVLVLIAVGCSSDGFPASYDEQIDTETGLSNVEQNWREGCEPSLSEEFADNAVAICGCSYARIKAEIPFEDFVETNSRLEANPAILGDLGSDANTAAAAIVEIVKNCIAEA